MQFAGLCLVCEALSTLVVLKDIVYVFSERFNFVLRVCTFNSPRLHRGRNTEGSCGCLPCPTRKPLVHITYDRLSSGSLPPCPSLLRGATSSALQVGDGGWLAEHCLVSTVQVSHLVHTLFLSAAAAPLGYLGGKRIPPRVGLTC